MVGLFCFIVYLLIGRVLSGRAFGTRFFICPTEQIKRAQTIPLTLTQYTFQNHPSKFQTKIHSR